MTRYRNAFLNLALPLLAFSEPSPAEEIEYPSGGAWEEGEAWTLWSTIDVAVAEEMSLIDLVKVCPSPMPITLSHLPVPAPPPMLTRH